MNRRTRQDMLIKLLIFCIITSFFVCYRIFYLKSNTDHPWEYSQCINDSLMSYLERNCNLSLYFSHHEFLQNILVNFYTISLDILFLFFVMISASQGYSLNALFQVVIFYICYYLFSLTSFPANGVSVSQSLSIPSLLSSFERYEDKSSGRVYSIHPLTSLPLLFSFGFHHMKYNLLCYISLCLCIFEFLLMFALRSSLSIEIILGLLIPHYSYIISRKITTALK